MPQSMTHFPADLLKILPNLEAVKIGNVSEANERPVRSGMCLSSRLAVISFLHVLAFSFWSASAGHPLSLGWQHANTHHIPREKSSLAGTRVHTGAVLGTMGNGCCCGFLPWQCSFWCQISAIDLRGQGKLSSPLWP